MELLLYCREAPPPQSAVSFEIRLNIRNAFGSKCVPKAPRALIQLRVREGDMIRLKGPGEELVREEPQVIFHGQLLRLRMQMLNCGSRVAAGGKPQRLVLHNLKLLYGSGRVRWINNGCAIVKQWPDEALEGQN